VERAFTLLRRGGRVKREPCELPWSPRAAEVEDRFGVWWYLSAPQHQPDETFRPEEFDY